MSGPRHDQILASTALALILAGPPGAFAQDKPAAFTERYPAEQASTQPPAATATEQAAPADPMASLDPADRMIAEKIRDLLAAKSDKIFASKKERTAVEAFYQNRNYAPFWLDKGIENERSRSVIARLKNADSDGLEVSDYRTPNFTDPRTAGSGANALAEAELKLTHSVLTYARHVQAGRFPHNRVSRNIELAQAPPEPAEVLNTIADAADAGKALDAYSPRHEPYRKLKAMLAEMRGKPGTAQQIDTIIANMERWRWYPRDLGTAHVLVNQPDFTLKVMHNGAQVWTTRIVIGKPSMQTPLLSETMKHITVNPTWNVPPSIVHNEYLPALAQDPTVLARMGLRVSYSGGGVHISQPPGDGNALGRIRFAFPNRFLVYQHDTPDKHMFGHDVRAYSHGCMRVQDPAKYAEVLLNIARPQEHWTAEKIKGMFGRTEQDLQLQPAQIWVHLTYQTAFVDDAGKLQSRRDVYSLDSRTLAAIKSERAVIEPGSAPERKREQEIASGSGRRQARAVRSNTSLFQSMFYDTPGYARPRVVYR